MPFLFPLRVVGALGVRQGVAVGGGVGVGPLGVSVGCGVAVATTGVAEGSGVPLGKGADVADGAIVPIPGLSRSVSPTVGDEWRNYSLPYTVGRFSAKRAATRWQVSMRSVPYVYVRWDYKEDRPGLAGVVVLERDASEGLGAITWKGQEDERHVTKRTRGGHAVDAVRRH